MDLELARKFILELLPPEAHIPIDDVFKAISQNPLLILNNSILHNQINYFKSPEKATSIAAANGVICGFALSQSMKNPEVCKMIKEYLEQAARSKGENVVSLIQRKGI